MEKQICEHCGSELTKASDERQQIRIDLVERQDKLDEASQNLLEMVARIEEKIGADEESREAIRLLQMRIRAKTMAMAEDEGK